ncbi:MAG: hypothetical protein OXE46_14530 [Chloroflexi bacterium]|nr:hypothetical protein [Chloroflexota bacterium]
MIGSTPKLSRLHNVSTPSAWTGIASLIDICGILSDYQTAPSGPRVDREALYSDWLAVGDYITDAVKNYQAEWSGETAGER